MFPLNSNEAYINDNGTRTTLGAAIGSGGGGGGTSELPEYGIADAGKVLTVANDGMLAWVTPSGGGGGSSFLRVTTPVNVSVTPGAEEGA